jgi:hypothetical protein
MTPIPTAVLVFAGTAAGWWMFAWRGAALFAGIAALVAVAFRVLGPHGPRVLPALALLLAAAGFHSASTLGWGGADAPDGTRFKASPVGLSHVLTPDRPVSETIDCGWHVASGYAEPCGVADARALRRLRAVYPLMLAAAVLALLGAGLSLAPPRRRAPQRALGALSLVAALLATALFAHSLPRALSDLAGLPVGMGGTLGTMQLVVAGLLCLAVALHPGRVPP